MGAYSRAGLLLDIPVSRVDAYLRGALIRGMRLIKAFR